MPQQRQAATALITGGRRGIGLAIARRLAADGHPIAVTGSGEADASTRAAVAELEKYGVPIGYFASDIAATAGHAAVLDSIERQLGPIAVLVSNAGIAPPERLDVLDTTMANFDAVLNTNLRGAFFRPSGHQTHAGPASRGRRPQHRFYFFLFRANGVGEPAGILRRQSGTRHGGAGNGSASGR
ncbi:hypothetical protein SODG_007263 [Sodalis praecaptivus]